MANVSIIWDLENVTPPSNNSLFIDGLWDYAEAQGRVISAKAYADWSIPNFARLGLHLKKYHFYLVHVPSERKKKNSVDIQLVSDTLELLRLYEHIESFVLVTGDSDFRPLLLALRRAGKKTHVVCDIKNASQELLAMADSFIDYREIMPGNNTPEDTETEPAAKQKLPADYWFTALAETITLLAKDGKGANLGNVKIRMKILNPEFDEKSLGFKRWSDFISAAVRKGVVRLEQDEDDEKLVVAQSEKVESKDKGVLQKALKALVECLEEMDGGKEAKFHEYGLVSSKLKDKKIDLKQFGFSQFKKFIQAADVRGLVESKTEEMQNFVKRN